MYHQGQSQQAVLLNGAGDEKILMKTVLSGSGFGQFKKHFEGATPYMCHIANRLPKKQNRQMG